ncbi:MAG TPA: DUF167 domain-containing protein [Vicinamibacterales bacterium]|nr:DUF167 domain-containing protein [Vicinamibacterales bacterium]
MTIDVRVIPRARRTESSGERDGAFVIRLAAPPVDGAANDALVEFLSDALNVPRRAVRIVSGERGRRKRVEIEGLTRADVKARLSISSP